jgi:hypothetical protein
MNIFYKIVHISNKLQSNILLKNFYRKIALIFNPKNEKVTTEVSEILKSYSLFTEA